MQAIAENCRNLTSLCWAYTSGISKPSLLIDAARNNIRLKYDRIVVMYCGGIDADPYEDDEDEKKSVGENEFLAGVLVELRAITAGR